MHAYQSDNEQRERGKITFKNKKKAKKKKTLTPQQTF